MNLTALLAELREDYLDDTVAPYLWSDTQLTRFLNRAQEEACMRQRLLVDVDTSAICEVTLVDAQSEYTLDSRIVLIEAIRYGTNTILTKRSRAELDRNEPYWRERTGDIDTYLQRDLTIRLIPTPTTSDDGNTIYLRVWRMPLADMSSGTDEPEIPAQYHRELIWFALGEAFSLPDEDTQDVRRADFYHARFDRAFGPYLGADVLAHKRREADVSYVGMAHAYHGRRTPNISVERAFDLED